MIYAILKEYLKNITFLPLKPALFFRIIWNYIRMVFLRKRVLRTLDIWITEECQCNCGHCCNSALMTSSRSKKLSLSDFDDIIAAARKMGVICLHFVGGEPLLCKELHEIIKLSKPNSIIISLVTNGILLKSKARDLKNAGLDLVNVSLDSPYSSKHDENRGFPGAFEAAIEGVIAAKDAGINVIVSMIVTHQNINNGEVEGMVSLTEKLKVDLQLLPARTVGNWADNPGILLDKDDMDKFHALTSKWNVRWDGRTTYFKNGCPAGVEKLCIDLSGNVYPCDFIPYSIGNIFNRDLKDIYSYICNIDLFKKWSPVCRSAFDEDFMREFSRKMKSE